MEYGSHCVLKHIVVQATHALDSFGPSASRLARRSALFTGKAGACSLGASMDDHHPEPFGLPEFRNVRVSEGHDRSGRVDAEK